MKERKVPMRRCVGCMESKEKQYLVRIAGYENEVKLDLTGRANGRGAYLCKDSKACLEKAYKRRALERSLRMQVTEEQKEAISAALKELNNDER